MKKIIIAMLMWPVIALAQEGVPYAIYNEKGKEVDFDKMMKGLNKADVVLFGEYHNNSLGHWLQQEVVKAMAKKHKVILGAEMFERDNAEEVLGYVKGEVSEEDFKEGVRFWNNYDTDYKPLVTFAKDNQLEFHATNVPRRYASLVYKGGVEALDSLSVEERRWIAPLPFPYDENLPAYQKMLTMFSDHGSPNFPKSQAIKDATMGYFIQDTFKAGHKYIHFNGSYHSDFYEGIVWYLATYAPELKVVTISMREAPNVNNWKSEEAVIGNYVIVIDENILKTF